MVTVGITGLLLWQYVHGGVPGHHILNHQDLPKISNWWGVVVLPLLTSFLMVRIEKRLKSKDAFKTEIPKIIQLLALGFLIGISIAISFTYDFKPFLDNILYALLLMSLVVPIFYSEFILGFVFSMTYTFGAVLPTLFILVLAGIGFLIFKFIRPQIVKLYQHLKS